jgi:hypothetical protein
MESKQKVKLEYIYILNVDQGKRPTRLDLRELSENFTINNNYKSVSYCEKNTSYTFHNPGIKIKPGFWCAYCQNDGKTHEQTCQNPFNPLLTTDGIKTILKDYVPIKPKNPEDPRYILYRIKTNTITEDDLNKLKNNYKEGSLLPGKTALTLKNVTVKRGRAPSKKTLSKPVCNESRRVVIPYKSEPPAGRNGLGKDLIIKVSKFGSVNIWSANKSELTANFLKGLCKKINDTPGAVLDGKEYKFKPDKSFIKSVHLRINFKEDKYKITDMKAFQKQFPDNKDFELPGLGKVTSVNLLTNKVKAGMEKTDTKTKIYMVFDKTKFLNVMIYEQGIHLVFSESTTNFGNDINRVESELKVIADKIMKLLPKKKLININKPKVKLTTFEQKQIKNNTMNGKAPNGKACRKTSGQSDRQTNSRPKPYSFHGKCSDGLNHRVTGNKFEGLWYPCCYSLGKAKEKEYRQYLIKGFDGPVDDSKTGTLIPGTTQRESRKFKGLDSKSKGYLIRAINKIRPPCKIKFKTRKICTASPSCPEGWAGVGKTKFYYLTNNTISNVLENDYYCYYIPVKAKIYHYSIQYNKLLVYSENNEKVYVRNMNKEDSKGLCIIENCKNILFKTDLTRLNDSIMTNFGRMDNNKQMLLIPKDSKDAPWLIVHKQMKSANFNPIKLQVFKTDNRRGYYNLGYNNKIIKQFGNVYLKSELTSKSYYTFKVTFTADGKLSSKLPFVKQKSGKSLGGHPNDINNTINYLNRNMTIYPGNNVFYMKFESESGVYADNKNGMRLTLVK